VEVICASELPQGVVFSEAFYYATSKLVSAELELDTLQDIYIHLADGARLTTEGVEVDTLGKLFGKVSSSKASRRAPVKCVCVRNGDLKRVRSFSAEFFASVPGGPKLRFMSLPGCFCHRRPDEGGVSLAEVASREIAEREIAAGESVPVLDIGSGCGLVGLLVSDALHRHGVADVPLALLDSHTRAIAAAKQNAASHGAEAECILSDVGLPEGHALSGKFKVALANPPYYGEGRIADLFAEIAFGALAPGGVCWMVAKTPDIINEACGKLFRNVVAIKRRGYTVLRAEKE
jgi:16S rRNA G1207 methylase RsmC